MSLSCFTRRFSSQPGGQSGSPLRFSGGPSSGTKYGCSVFVTSLRPDSHQNSTT